MHDMWDHMDTFLPVHKYGVLAFQRTEVISLVLSKAAASGTHLNCAQAREAPPSGHVNV